jgi:hypothetical protein
MAPLLETRCNDNTGNGRRFHLKAPGPKALNTAAGTRLCAAR